MDARNAISSVGAAAAGAAVMYMLDPQHGRRRRALVRDKVVHAAHVSGDALQVAGRDLAHRAVGFAAEQWGALMPKENIPSDKLEARARATMGRIVSHPHAIHIDADADGRLVVSGHILEQEVEPLLAALSGVAGVREVESHLEPAKNAGDIPSLQGGRRRPSIVPDILQQQMAPATRLLMGAGAVAAIAYGLGRKDLLGNVLAGLGSMAGIRAATNAAPARMLGGRGAIRLQNSIEVDAPVDLVYQFFEHFENFPRFMQHIRHVRFTDSGVWHWEADGPLGMTVKWDAIVTRQQRNRRISWRSIPGSEIFTAGTVWFEPTRQGGTRVHINMVYHPPAGALGHAVASLLGADPIRQMDEDLVRFQSLIERGKTSAKGEEVLQEHLAV